MRDEARKKTQRNSATEASQKGVWSSVSAASCGTEDGDVSCYPRQDLTQALNDLKTGWHGPWTDDINWTILEHSVYLAKPGWIASKASQRGLSKLCSRFIKVGFDTLGFNRGSGV